MNCLPLLIDALGTLDILRILEMIFIRSLLQGTPGCLLFVRYD